MSSRRRSLTAAIFALVLAALVSTSAFAHVCTNPNKKAGAGSVGTYNVVTEEFVPSQRFAQMNINEAHPPGAFITFHDGSGWSVDIYIHQTLPEGALDAGPGADNYCDGIGVDLFLACIRYPGNP